MSAQSDLALISSPVQGQVLTGAIDVVGTATHPDFVHYEVSFAYDPNLTDTWFPALPVGESPVQGDTLGIWDTTAMTDGLYMLRLQVFWGNELRSLEFVSGGLVVANNYATSTPVVESNTSALQNSNAQIIVAHPPVDPDPRQGTTSTLLPDQLLPYWGRDDYRTSFYRGGLFSCVVFLALALYVNLRKVLRPRLRRFLRRLISDLRRP